MSELEVGAKLLVAVNPDTNRGVDHAVAFVTAVKDPAPDLSTGRVNLQLLPNDIGTRFLVDVPVYATEAAARSAIIHDPLESVYVAWWPVGQADRDAAVAAMTELLTVSQADAPPADTADVADAGAPVFTGV